MRALLFIAAVLSMGAALFDGSSNGTGTGANWPTVSTNVISLSYWVKPQAQAADGTVVELSANYNTTTPSFAIFTLWTSGVEYYAIHGTSGYHDKTSPSAVTTNSWSHRAVVFSRTTSTNRIRAYWNGSEIALSAGSFSNAGGTTDFATSAPLYLGARGASSVRLSASIASFAVYSGELSSDDIAALASGRVSPLGVRSAMLISYWPLRHGENAANSVDLVSGVAMSLGSKSMVQDQPNARR